jgi:hypothetical protein
MPSEHELEVERRRCLIRDLLRRTDRNGVQWLEQFVRGWKFWRGIRDDFREQRRLGNRGEYGDWRE